MYFYGEFNLSYFVLWGGSGLRCKMRVQNREVSFRYIVHVLHTSHRWSLSIPFLFAFIRWGSSCLESEFNIMSFGIFSDIYVISCLVASFILFFLSERVGETVVSIFSYLGDTWIIRGSLVLTFRFLVRQGHLGTWKHRIIREVPIFSMDFFGFLY